MNPKPGEIWEEPLLVCPKLSWEFRSIKPVCMPSGSYNLQHIQSQIQYASSLPEQNPCKSAASGCNGANDKQASSKPASLKQSSSNNNSSSQTATSGGFSVPDHLYHTRRRSTIGVRIGSGSSGASGVPSTRRSSSDDSSERSASPTLLHRECQYCHNQQAALKKCSNCRVTMYCSMECQHLDWKSHKPVCKAKNPVFFTPGSLDQIKWFYELSKTDMQKYLIEAFKQRLMEEVSVIHLPVNRHEILRKLIRFLEAARGLVIPQGTFTKSELISLKQMAVYPPHNLFMLADQLNSSFRPRTKSHSIHSGGLSGEYATRKLQSCTDFLQQIKENNTFAQKNALLNISMDQLQILHHVICGPIKIEGETIGYNLI